MTAFYKGFLLIVSSFIAVASLAQDVRMIKVDSGWANNSVNAVIFRKNSLATWKDTQFIAFYNNSAYVVLGKRKTSSKKWLLQQTLYKGNTADAHNSISLMADGDGFLHLAWDHHNHPLRYAQSIAPGSLDLTSKRPMTGSNEQSVSYPEFYRLPNGNLLFFYRDGRSGQGNMVINHYDIKTKKWRQLQSNLVNGEGKRNAYWQACTDSKGTIHLSWVWRESPDVASNHDICYARSSDEGITWEKSNGEKYLLPITASTAEYAWRIPQNSELINQTSMAADDDGNPFIASYWRTGTNAPQYHLVYCIAGKWKELELSFRKTAFSLSGMGTKRIPISRPQVLARGRGDKASVLLIFRDEERDNKVSAAVINKIKKRNWEILDLTQYSVGSWEPSFDTELWKEKSILNLFVQKVEQVDGEGKANIRPQLISVLEWKPKF